MGGFGQLYPRGAPPFPPLDIPYLASMLLERQIPVDVIESGALDLSTADLCTRLQADPQASTALILIRTSLADGRLGPADLPAGEAALRACGGGAVWSAGPIAARPDQGGRSD